MADELPIASPAADAPDATPTPETNPDVMTPEKADALLKSLGNQKTEADPLTDDGSNLYPLIDEGGQDILGELPPEDAALETAPADELPPEHDATELPPDEPTITAESDGRKRINILRKNADGTFFFSARDRALMNEVAEAGGSLEEAAKRLFGQQADAAPTAEPVAAVKPRTSAEITAEMDALQQKIDDAATSYDRATERKLSRDLQALTLAYATTVLEERQSERDAKVQEQTAQSAFAEAESASFDEVKTKFPDAWVAGSDLNKAIWAEMNRLETAQPNFKSDPDWPFTLAAKVATRKGIPAKAAAAATAKPVAPLRVLPNAPVRRATPVPAPGVVSGAQPAIDPAMELSKQIKAAKESGDDRALETLMQKAIALGRAA